MLKGFKNFLMQGNLIVIAVGLVVATAFSTLIKAFTDSIITPLVSAMEGSSAGSPGLGWTVNHQFVDLGTFISAIIYFLIFMVVIYFVRVVPYALVTITWTPLAIGVACSVTARHDSPLIFTRPG